MRALDNVTLTPHVAAYAEESVGDLYRVACRIAVDVLQGRRPPSLVNPTVAVRSYIVDMQCPVCGELHLVTSGLHLEHGPTEAGSVADLYGEGELPSALAHLLKDKVCCDTSNGWVRQQDRTRMFLTPRNG